MAGVILIGRCYSEIMEMLVWEIVSESSWKKVCCVNWRELRKQYIFLEPLFDFEV